MITLLTFIALDYETQSLLKLTHIAHLGSGSKQDGFQGHSVALLAVVIHPSDMQCKAEFGLVVWSVGASKPSQ